MWAGDDCSALIIAAHPRETMRAAVAQRTTGGGIIKKKHMRLIVTRLLSGGNTMKVTTLLVVLLLSGTAAFAEDDWCLTSTSPIDPLKLLNVEHPYPHEMTSAVIRIQVHLVRRSDGTGGITSQQADEQLEWLFDGFAPHGVSFVEIGRDEVLISNEDWDLLHLHHKYSLAPFMRPDAVDIFLVDPTHPLSFGSAFTVPSTALVVCGNRMFNGVIVHEMGHCLGLYHLHEHEFGLELPGGSNCEDAGDLVCDTPACPLGPGLGLRPPLTDEETCELTPIFFQYYSEYVPAPDPTNYMAYSTMDCIVHFTDEQVDRMYAHLEQLPILQATLQDKVAKFANVSSGSGLDYSGTPYAAAALNFNSDSRGDLLITSTGGPARLYAGDLPGGNPDAPRFAPVTLPGGPLHDCRGVAVADFDNDGDEDIFLTHASTPKMYRNDDMVGFADVTATLGFSALADNSTAACWADFDRDGWLDLYVVRSGAVGVPACSSVSGLQHRLFRNMVGHGGGFVDITTSAGLSGVADLAALSICAADIDGDRDIDLFVPRASTWVGGAAPHSLLLVNDGTGSFANVTASKLGAVVASCPAAEFADMDNDGDADLVVANDTGAPRVFLNDGSGSYLSDPEIISAPEGHAGMKVFDQNLDGVQDVLLLSRDANHSCRLFVNRGDKSFVAMSTLAGLQTVGQVSAVVATDFNGDGDADLFLGRPVSSYDFLLRSGGQDGGPSIGRNYVKIKLESEYCGNNSAGIGARVTVTAGALVQTLSPDGGSGRGSQGDRTLVFGLADYSGPVSAKVRWPGGWITEIASLTISNATSGETVNVIADDTSPTVSNVVAASLADPITGNLIWQFTWETDVSCDPSKDIFLIDQAGLPIPCLPGWGEINHQSGLTHVYQSKTTGGYTHKFLEVSEPCTLNCRIRYSATSAAGTRSSTSPLQSKRIFVCPSQN